MEKVLLKEQTKKSQIKKSIELELVPEAATARAIDCNKLLEADKRASEMATEIKVVYDDFIKYIIKESLSTFCYDFGELNKCRENDKAYTKKCTEFSDMFIKHMDNCMPSYVAKDVLFKLSINKIDSAEFIKDFMPNWVAENYEGDEKNKYLDALDCLVGKTPLMTRFATTRISTLRTAVPKRILENFEIYLENAVKIDKLISGPYAEKVLQLYPEIKKMIIPDAYLNYITIEGIAYYNSMISGLKSENGTVKKGYNNIAAEISITESVRYKMAKQLNSQILFPKEKQFVIDSISTNEEAISVLRGMQAVCKKEKLQQICTAIKKTNPEGVIVSGKKLHMLSHCIFGKHEKISSLIIDKRTAALEQKIENSKLNDIKKLKKEIGSLSKQILMEEYSFEDLTALTGTKIKAVFVEKLTNLIEKIETSATELSLITAENIKKFKGKIASACDTYREIRDVLLLINNPDSDNADITFYEMLTEYLEEYNIVIKGINLLRNYLTRSEKEIAKKQQICLGNIGLYDTRWWKKSDKIDAREAVIIKKIDENGKNSFFYAIKNPTIKKTAFNIIEGNSNCYALSCQNTRGQSAQKGLPKNAFLSAVKKAFEDKNTDEYILKTEKIPTGLKFTREIYNIYTKKLATTGTVKDGTQTEEEFKANLEKLIRFYMDFISVHSDYNFYGFDFKRPSEYNNLMEFYEDVDSQGVKYTWIPISENDFNNSVENMSILVWKFKPGRGYYKYLCEILTENNLENTTMYLNSRPALFYRKAVISKDEKITHPVGSIMVNKRDVNGNKIPYEVYTDIYKYLNKMSNKISEEAAEYLNKNLVKYFTVKDDVISKKRYREDKYLIALSYTKNIDVTGELYGSTINTEYREHVKNNNFNILSVIRGVSNLLYYVVTDTTGNIIEKESLNVIGGVNYKNILRLKSNQRNVGKSITWDYDIEDKNIKLGYISNAISVLVSKMLEYNAICVIDKVNENFKNKMFAIDDQLYKTFETLLERRLQDMVVRKTNISNPYQLALANNMSSSQNGVLFYISSAYTVKTCPITGFVNIFDTRDIAKIDDKKAFISRFNSIKFNDSECYYECRFDFNNFDTICKPKRCEWTLAAEGINASFNQQTEKYKEEDSDAIKLLELCIENGLDKNSDLALIAREGKLNSKIAIALYNLIIKTLCITSVWTEDGERKYVSPVKDGSRYVENASCVAAVTMTKKLKFILMNEIEKNSFLEEWINYLQ